MPCRRGLRNCRPDQFRHSQSEISCSVLTCPARMGEEGPSGRRHRGSRTQALESRSEATASCRRCGRGHHEEDQHSPGFTGMGGGPSCTWSPPRTTVSNSPMVHSWLTARPDGQGEQTSGERWGWRLDEDGDRGRNGAGARSSYYYSRVSRKQCESPYYTATLSCSRQSWSSDTDTELPARG